MSTFETPPILPLRASLRYREQVVEHYNRWQLLIPEQDTVALEQIFVKLNLELSQQGGLNFEEKQAKLEGRLSAEIERREFIRRHTKHQPQTVTLSVAEALLKLRRLLVIGGPGSGKTTLTRWLALTFARNEQAERLGAHFTQPRLPILLELRHFADRAEAFSEQPTVPDLADEIANYISQHSYFLGISAEFIHEQLALGRCLLLIDGLDEIRFNRRKIIRAINAFFQYPDRAYRDNLCLITSRSSGYLETKLEVNFINAKILPFTIEDVRLLIEHLYNTASCAREETLNLLEAIRENKQVANLATNPLLCTIIAIVYRNNRSLPNRRASLYLKYCEILPWEHNKQVSGRYDWQTNLDLLALLAYWLHNRSQLAAPFDSFVNQLEQILIEKKLESATQASVRARRFLVAIRDTSGLLQDRENGSLEFSHRSVQEYLAARHIAAHPQEQIIDLVMPHLHDAWWREVHLLTIGHLGSDSTTAPQASVLLEQILTVYRPPWPRRSSYSLNIPKWLEKPHTLKWSFIAFWSIPQVASLFLAETFPKWQLTRRLAWVLEREFELAAAGYAECTPFGTTIVIDQLLNDKATSLLLRLTYEPLYREKDLDLLRAAKQVWEKQGYTTALDSLLTALTNGNSYVRSTAARRLGQLGQATEQVVKGLLVAVDDRDSDVREAAAKSLVQLGQVNPQVEQELAIVADRNSSVREAVISHLGQLGETSPQVEKDLLRALTDKEWKVRRVAAHSLAQLGQASPQIVSALLTTLTDEDSVVRRAAAKSLGQLGQANPMVISALLTALTNVPRQPSEESRVREGAARSLGELGQAHPVIISGLLAARSACASHSWLIENGKYGKQPPIVWDN